jgi:hypothetical protein
MGRSVDFGFNNGWMMIPLEQMAGHSQSAADEFV